MAEALPTDLAEAAKAAGLDVEGNQILYVTRIGDLLINHFTIADDGLRIVMNVSEHEPELTVSTTSVSDPISKENAYKVVDRWGKLKEFEAQLDLTPVFRR